MYYDIHIVYNESIDQRKIGIETMKCLVNFYQKAPVYVIFI